MAKSKKELDKDLMFSKIMPALNSNPFSSDLVSDKAVEEAEDEASSDSLSALRDKIFARSPSYNEPETISTINVMESLVLKNVDAVIQRFNVCSCDRCRCDICAYALNILPPRYAVVQSSKIEQVEMEISNKTIMDALIKAAIQIRSHPHH
ncbi:MAG: late competence development ComFB family protein [Oscillospiraceae bacterium]|nr:late competence development ComFB family protein [Oscillospiraceae bacterium]